MIQEITFETLKTWRSSNRHFLLIDVREDFERAVESIGGTHIPLNTFPSHIASLPNDSDIVIYCAKGIRSVIALQRLEAAGFTRLFNLKGGMSAIPKAK